jgi:hypothetical protein
MRGRKGKCPLSLEQRKIRCSEWNCSRWEHCRMRIHKISAKKGVKKWLTPL